MHRFIPKQVSSAVLLLHGLGANGADLMSLGEEWSGALPHTAFFSPDAPEPCDMAPFGFQWFSLRDWTTASIENGLRRARLAADTLIDEVLKEFSLPASRLALCGFSQGAMLSLHAGLQRKEPLAGIIGYSGALFGFGPEGDQIITKPPVLLAHGTADEVVPCQASQMAEQALKQAGVPVEFHAIPGLGHGIDSTGLDLGQKFLQKILAA
ncbi:MAG TPA: prolyl oligopeptidase family serine peptidase [Alphaproteobacteria bacterium]|nr:prolyl oligopeptidase family serine peptidase [Alphaproteobacteria bacterium]